MAFTVRTKGRRIVKLVSLGGRPVPAASQKTATLSLSECHSCQASLSKGPKRVLTPFLFQELTGIDVAADRLQTEVLNEFRRETDWDVEPGTWSENERTLTESLASEKYRQTNWNEKR